MAKYSDGVTVVKVGDVAECMSSCLVGAQRGLHYTVTEVCDWPSLSTAQLIRLDEFPEKTYGASMFKLIRRAPSPEPEQPAVNNEQSPPLVELVNHPPHYAGLSPEPVDVIEAWQLEWHEGNAMEHIARAKNKGERVQDLRKAAWYLNRKAEMLEKNYIQPME